MPFWHKALPAFVLERTERVRVCLEASGNYSLDLALALHGHGQVEVSVINPRRARKFAESLGERSKTDPVDARVLSCSTHALGTLAAPEFTRNRLLKVPEGANIKLSSLATDVFGVSGRLMLRALIDGKTSPQEMATLAKGKVPEEDPGVGASLGGQAGVTPSFSFGPSAQACACGGRGFGNPRTTNPEEAGALCRPVAPPR